MTTPAALTVGVEEEFFLLDPQTGANLPVVEKVAAALPDSVRDGHRWEFRRCMLELVTPVCTSLPDLRNQLGVLRRAGGEAAAAAGARLVSIGATPVSDAEREPADGERFRAVADYYGPIGHDPAICGCHVHVQVPSRAAAVLVCDHIRPWLPVVQALAANSPFHLGADTGYASWRAIQLDRWPSSGPTPYFGSSVGYDRAVRALVDTGVMLDRTMVLWHARPSTRHPTVEVRLADACLTVDDTVLVAGLIRALVGTALERIAADQEAAQVPEHLLRAAHWNAARSGVSESLAALPTAEMRPAWTLVTQLLNFVEPMLVRNGDHADVLAALARVRQEGTGADRQRALFDRYAALPAVLDRLAALSVPT